jgi:hypothetical protein
LKARRSKGGHGRFSGSTKRKGVGVNTGIEKFDLEGVVRDGAALAHELIEAMLGDDAGTIRRRIDAVAIAGQSAVDSHTETHRLAVTVRPEHQMKVARVEAIDDASTCSIENRVLAVDRPIAREAPLVELRRRDVIVMADILLRTIRRDEILGPGKSDIGFRRGDVFGVGGVSARSCP